MKVAVTGSTGLVGSLLVPALSSAGHEALRLVRHPPAGKDEIFWDPDIGQLDEASLEGIGAVVHLAGENIAARRWNADQKARIRDSRIHGTHVLATALARLKTPPKVLVAASAVGFYGDRGDGVLTEESAGGQGFLADVCREWEAAADPARQKGIRVVHLRFGVVLSPKEGALKKMLPAFRLGVAGVIGNGKQYWSWISVDDAAGAILHALANESLRGPVNGVSPQPATNREFTKTLGNVLKRPTLLPMPAFAARLVLGEMADALLLASDRVEPRKLAASGYRFRHPDLKTALRELLK